jgi:hypothetical protein
MDTQRETKKVKTKGGFEIEYYSYATGREYNQIQDIYLKDAKMTMIGNDIKIDGFNPIAETEVNKKTIELLVVSLNGVAENIVDRIMDLPYHDYNEITEILGDVSGKKKAVTIPQL